jgi:TusE/DsrC/DsvC family sulfur relay protein
MSDPGTFRFAPLDWSAAAAQRIAAQEGLTLGQAHWDLVRALQEFYARNPSTEMRLRDLQAALEEKFHHKGGLKYLYTICPGGPVAQGCRLAGLHAPAGASDLGFGSVS